MMRVENVGLSETTLWGGLVGFATTVNTSLGLINPFPRQCHRLSICSTVKKYYLKSKKYYLKSKKYYLKSSNNQL